MRVVFTLVATFLVTVAKLLGSGGVKGVVAENLVLKQQLIVLNRSRRRAPNLQPIDRLIFGVGSLLLSWKRISKVAVVIRPSTILNFHRVLVRRKYRMLSSTKTRGKPGPKGPSKELVSAIVELRKRNPRFGCPMLAQIVSKTFGIEIDKDVVRRVLAKHYSPSTSDGGSRGPSWLAFLGHTKDSLWSIDLFRCESINLRTHWVLVVMDQFTRRIIGFGVQAGAVDGVALCRMFNDATAGMSKPKRLSTDNDPLFLSNRWLANLRILGVDEVKSVPHVPVSHPFVERLIGTARREYLDHVLFWNRIDLERKLAIFQTYFNTERVHQSLGGDTPNVIAGELRSKVANLEDFAWKSTCNGLVELPKAA